VCKKEYINLQTGELLDLEKVNTLKDSAMLKVRPDLWEVWDFEKNNELGFDIWEMTKGIDKRIWWYCDFCDESYLTKVKSKVIQVNYKHCSIKNINHSNSIYFTDYELALEWHPTKNGDLTPHDVTCSSGKKVWWLGKCGHEWEAKMSDRTHGNNCPYCADYKALKGFNDMWTTNPKLASLLANPKDGYKYMQASGKPVDWKCPSCGEIIKSKSIASVKRRGLSCPSCSDGISYTEKFMYNLLKELNVKFVKELTSKNFNWISDKRYDFYIPSLNMIIETHGGQHSDDKGFESIGGKTAEEEKENDKYKRELALQNGIKHYIELDCRKSNMEYIKNSIINSKLVEMLDLSDVDWKHIALQSEKSLVIDVCNIWNKGLSLGEIVSKTMLSHCTILNYLIRGCNIGICNYNKRESRTRGQKNTIKNNSRRVIQLNLNNEYMETFSSISEASNKTGVLVPNIIKCCKGKYSQSGGYKWMYKEDYDRYIEEQNSKSA